MKITSLDKGKQIFTLQSLSVYDVAEVLCGRKAKSAAQLHHQHTMIRHLHTTDTPC